ncbi:alpha-(1,6)-fucosyltransferase-like isoform X2 [Penaeus chinensis]|uniref:alpha-(1,6)-fucosyltransferase-like isoform X2 n=1 Tax=Penaeus chinensis TaxID=139456 RepID=UPI001FB6BB43|nr:alpha-(1,6)-fucosyltransferase-like isoform X2 [Penaeus chinensis]
MEIPKRNIIFIFSLATIVMLTEYQGSLSDFSNSVYARWNETMETFSGRGLKCQGRDPSLEAEKLRRRVASDVSYAWQYIRYHLTHGNSSGVNLEVVLEDLDHHFRVTSHDLAQLSEVDGLHEWRKKEAAALSALVQHRLRVLQNPSDCATAKKIYCDFKNVRRGIGSHMHHLSCCFLASYGTQRTLILDTDNYNGNPRGLTTLFLPLSDTCTGYNSSQIVPWPGEEDSLLVQFPEWDQPDPRPSYLPWSIPKDFSKRLMRLHGDPYAWWLGQIFNYTMRMNKEFREYFANLTRDVGYESPIVGVHVRRTDKLGTEAMYLHLETYMERVKLFYQELALKQTVTEQRVFLTTDDWRVIEEFKEKYPEYRLVYNQASIQSASPSERTKGPNLRFLMADVLFLSQSDYLVCGMTSNVCRLAYELMQSIHPDASTRAWSVDSPLLFDFYSFHYVRARFNHTPRRSDEIELQEGDIIQTWPFYFSNHLNLKDGFLYGTNNRTQKAGLYPAYKTIDALNMADIQSFERIDKMNVRR